MQMIGGEIVKKKTVDAALNILFSIVYFVLFLQAEQWSRLCSLSSCWQRSS